MGLAGVRLAISAPHLIFKRSTGYWQIFYSILTFLVTPFHPLILGLKQYLIELKLRSVPGSNCLKCTLSNAISEETEERRKSLLDESIEIQYHLCNHVKLELGLETIFQLCIKLILLAYSQSNTRTTEGLSTMFHKDFLLKENDDALNVAILIFLYASTCWSFISNVNAHLTGLSAKRRRFPFASKVAAAFYAFFATTSRILTIVIFFTPSLGLFDTLRQWQGEQFQRHPAMINEFVTNKTLFFPKDSITIELNSSSIFKTSSAFGLDGLYLIEGFDDNMYTIVPEHLQNKAFLIHGEIQYGNSSPMPWSYLDRCTYNLDGEHVTWPKYTLYTLLGLKAYFFIFVGILVTQTIVIFLVKVKLSKKFSNFNFLDMLIHSIEVSNLAYNAEEWDSIREGNADAHIQQMQSNRTEGLVLILINFIFKLIMLCPLYILGNS